jgi:hypothetical protein
MKIREVAMQRVMDAAEAQGRLIGHDGVAVATDVMDVMPVVCKCDGSGKIPVKFGGTVIATVDCPGCTDT